jgi:hypothetical protein
MGFVACGQDRLMYRIAPTRIAKVREARASEYQAEGWVGESHAIKSLEVRLVGGGGRQEKWVAQFVERRTIGGLGENSEGAARVMNQRHEIDVSA